LEVVVVVVVTIVSISILTIIVCLSGGGNTTDAGGDDGNVLPSLAQLASNDGEKKILLKRSNMMQAWLVVC
jgi:hypothetical protein